MYKNLREAWLSKLTKPENFSHLPPQDKLKLVLNKPENVRLTAQYIVSVMDLRRQLNKHY